MKKAGETPALPGRAIRLAGMIPRERLEPSVLRWAEERPARERWAVAFSGGPDSLALLLLLWAHWPERRARLQALHFDHRLRGAESRRDAVFCGKVCAALGVKFVGGVWKRGASSKPRVNSPEASEAKARAARMAFFAKHARVVWLGHQQDDIAETFFMRLARGSGTGGLAAPRPVQAQPGGRVHVRPLLALKKSEIVAALRAAGLPWREDSTNAGRNFFRNRVRRDVLPAWDRAAERDALAGAARSRLLLEEDDAALETLLDELRPIEGGGRRTGPVLRLTVLAGKPRALWRRALHRWLGEEPRAGEISRQAFEALLEALERGRRTRHSLGREGFAVTDGGRLWFQPVVHRRGGKTMFKTGDNISKSGKPVGKRPRSFRRSAN